MKKNKNEKTIVHEVRVFLTTEIRDFLKEEAARKRRTVRAHAAYLLEEGARERMKEARDGSRSS